MNKHLATLLLIACIGLGACESWPGLADPSFSIAPQIVLLRATGKTRMGPAPTHGNLAQSLAGLGTGERDEEIGGTLSYGDDRGFAGFELDYLKLDSENTTPGTTTSPWGDVPSGVDVNTRLRLEEFRLRYIADIVDYEDEDEDVWFKAGLGVQLNHREMSLSLADDATPSTQKIDVKDIVAPMAAVRLGGGRGPMSLIADFAINDDWGFGSGDFEGRYYDLSIRASYYLEAQDLTLFGGYRRFEILASGNEGPLRYDVDFTFDGWFFGVRFIF